MKKLSIEDYQNDLFEMFAKDRKQKDIREFTKKDFVNFIIYERTLCKGNLPEIMKGYYIEYDVDMF